MCYREDGLGEEMEDTTQSGDVKLGATTLQHEHGLTVLFEETNRSWRGFGP